MPLLSSSTTTSTSRQAFSSSSSRPSPAAAPARQRSHDLRCRDTGRRPAPAPRQQQQQASHDVRCRGVQKQSDISTADWRTQKMRDVCVAFFERVWSRGEVELIDSLVTEDFVWKDSIWMPNRPIVGRKAFNTFVQQMRTAYPDLGYDLGQVGVCDPLHVFVHWDCHGTNLHETLDAGGKPHKPTFHESHISGVDLIAFNNDRSMMREVVIYRQPTLEEREFLEEEALSHDRLAIKLERLHFDGRS